MKYYDYKKAYKYLEENKSRIAFAYLGMAQDWFYTADLVFKNDKYVIDLLQEGLEIAGINGSFWATPCIKVLFKDGTSFDDDMYIEELTNERDNK